jgi:hypothetical protein
LGYLSRHFVPGYDRSVPTGRLAALKNVQTPATGGTPVARLLQNLSYEDRLTQRDSCTQRLSMFSGRSLQNRRNIRIVVEYIRRIILRLQFAQTTVIFRAVC